MFYFDWACWGRMLRYAWNESDARRARKLFALLLLRVPLIAGINAICFALDPLFFPGLRSTEIREPVFVIGHGRSGTTHLHDLLYRDDRFSCFLMYELFWPALLPKVLIRWGARFDEERLGGSSHGEHRREVTRAIRRRAMPTIRRRTIRRRTTGS